MLSLNQSKSTYSKKTKVSKENKACNISTLGNKVTQNGSRNGKIISKGSSQYAGKSKKSLNHNPSNYLTRSSYSGFYNKPTSIL